MNNQQYFLLLSPVAWGAVARMKRFIPPTSFANEFRFHMQYQYSSLRRTSFLCRYRASACNIPRKFDPESTGRLDREQLKAVVGKNQSDAMITCP